ncbi:MAG: hypothetical protein QOE06_1588 [Thermoleophilaceae bacterium]|jgi:hypothetical protein|nr:hypothetical protein [Thermoleophilaceae bacterium]
MDAFEQQVRAAMELAEQDVDDTDIAIMRVADEVYGSQVRALLAEDLHDVKPELDFDPSRAPTS